ncbi:MAG TPA: diacylglycerol kinase family protein [Pyrinomonadaceae bacterium]|jgi:YegS/Rv2252/BmrU family lipid kinase|nr:diacylglycerol kinase family protein [Pyrinomonadaceae bacterium]
MSSGVEVIFNASAGVNKADEVERAVASAFDACGVEARVHLAREGAEVERLVRRALSNGARAIVAGGGDGTVSAVASLLAGTEKPLGVLPLGTLNHFAKDLGVPLDIVQAARSVCEGRVVCVDVGEVNGKIFVNNSSLGLYPRIVRRREKLQERLGSGKWAAFLRAALAILRRYPFLNVRLRADGQEIVRRTPFVFVGNNEYLMESFQIGARARLDGGCLSLYVAHRTGRLGLLRLAVRALFGRLREAKDFDALRAQEIRVETHRPKRLHVAADGEVSVMTTPLHYRVLPGALRVIVPKGVNREP